MGASRLVASRAQIAAGLDVAALDSGFAVGLASTPREATGLRLGGVGMRVLETLRVKAPASVAHVAVDQGRDDDADAMDIRYDQGDVRTVAGFRTSDPFRLIHRQGAISAVLDESTGHSTVKPLWVVPPSRPLAPAKPVADVLRAAARDDGGAVVALRRASTLWVGVVDATIAPAGPLVSIPRKTSSLGAPALATWGGGGAVAWAEKPLGEHDWVVVVASFSPDGEGESALVDVRVIGKGMSPTLAELPDGDLLLAHSDGPAGAHRVVASRLGRDLEPRGRPVVVSPEAVNAGQPSLAVRADGRALIAFFAAARGRSPSVHATALACDPGL
jgi:hypothetical protein